jgi:hypothetical protein
MVKRAATKETRAAPSEPTRRTDTPLYLYGIMRAGSRPLLHGDGVSGHTHFRMVDAGRLTGVVSELDTLPRGTRHDVEAHLRVLQEAMEWGTVLPMRFGVTVPSTEALVDGVLEPTQDAFERILDRLDGMVEMRVRATYLEEPVLREIVRERPDIRRMRDRVATVPADASYYDRIRLGEAVAQAMAARTGDDAPRILRRLRPLAADMVQDEQPSPRVVVAASFLVRLKDAERFRTEGDKLAADVRHRITIRMTGPLPAFSFVDEPSAAARRR